MNPKQNLSENILSLLRGFYEETGVAVSDIRVEWLTVHSQSEVTNTYSLGRIEMETKP